MLFRSRAKIDEYCKRIDHVFHSMNWGKANGIVKAEFGVARDAMDLPQLRQVWAFLQKRFPIREVI